MCIFVCVFLQNIIHITVLKLHPHLYWFSFAVYYSRFLVIGGDGHKTTEVIDLSDSSLRCKSTFGKLKSERRNAMGGLINETPITVLKSAQNRRMSQNSVFAETEYVILLVHLRASQNMFWNFHNPAFF